MSNNQHNSTNNSPIQNPNSSHNLPQNLRSNSNLPTNSNKVVIKSFDIIFVIWSIFGLLMICVAWVSNFLMIAFTVKEATFQSYFWGCLAGIILYFVWIILYSLQKDYLIFTNGFVQSFQTDFFLLTKKMEFPMTNLQGFESSKIRRRSNGGINFYSYKLQLLTKDNQKIHLLNSDFGHKKSQKLIQEIKDTQNLEFDVVENQKTERYFNTKSTFEVVILMLFYVFLPIFVYFLFRF